MNGRSETIASYELSRVYSQGWTKAKQLLAAGDGAEDGDPYAAAAHKPYLTERERAHWEKGFNQAIESRAGLFSIPGGSSWRAAAIKQTPAGGKARK